MSASAPTAPASAPAPVPVDYGPVPAFGMRAQLPNDNAISANLRAALIALRRYIWTAVAIVAAVLALTLISTMLATPRYTAIATVQINDQSDEVLGADFESTSMSPPADWDISRFLNTQLEILQSRTLAERVVDALALADSERFAAAMDIPATKAKAPLKARRDAAIQLLRDNLSVELPRDTRIAQIRFTSTDAEMSARIADAFAQEYIQANLQRRFDASSYARNFVSEQLDEARADLEESEQTLNAYARSVGLIRTRDALAPDMEAQGAGSVTATNLLKYNNEAVSARAARIAAQARWDAVRSSPLMSSREVLANTAVNDLVSRKAELEAKVVSARARYLPDNPTLRNLEAELASVRSELTRAANAVRDSIRAEYEAAATTEAKLMGEVNQARAETITEQDQSVRYNTLAREADTARSIYDGLLQRFRELNASAGIATSNIAIIDRAEIPKTPSSPNLPRNLALGLLAGVVLAAFAVFLRDQLDDVIHTPEDVEEKLGLSLLGVIPISESEDPIGELSKPKSQISEAYFSLRGALLYSTSRGLPKVIVVTSAQANEGKTTTSFAMADSLARIGLKPLLIDADLRRPSLQKHLGIENKRGLTDLLVSQDDPKSAVVRVKGRKVDFLPAGPVPPSPSELLSSPRMAQVLEAYAQTYDVVIIDSPPVLGLADAPMLAAIADGTVFVIEADRGRSGALKAALRRLRSVDPVMLGAVFSKFDPSRSGNRYSAYFGYDYYEYAAGVDA